MASLEQNLDSPQTRQNNESNQASTSLSSQKERFAPCVYFVVTIGMISFGLYDGLKTGNYQRIHTLGLTLLGILLTPFSRGLIQFVEKVCCSCNTTTEDSTWKIFKSCFKRIKWKPIILLSFVDLVALIPSISLRGSPYVEIGDLFYIVSGSGMASFVNFFLDIRPIACSPDLNSSEALRVYPSEVLAFHYYRHRLIYKLQEITSPKFYTDGIPVQDEARQKKIQLASKKMIVLIPTNCQTKEEIKVLDNDIQEICAPGCNIRIFSIEYDNGEKCHSRGTVAIEYPRDILDSILQICKDEDCKYLHPKDVVEEGERFLNKLSQYLKEDNLGNNCILVPLTPEFTRTLSNGVLTKRIVKTFRDNEELETPEEPKDQPSNSGKINIDYDSDHSNETSPLCEKDGTRCPVREPGKNRKGQKKVVHDCRISIPTDSPKSSDGRSIKVCDDGTPPDLSGRPENEAAGFSYKNKHKVSFGHCSV